MRVFELLIERGANVNIAAGEGDTNPLIACCYSNDPHMNIIGRLLEAGADPKTQDTHNGNAIAIAELYKQPALVALLKKYATKKRSKKSSNPKKTPTKKQR